MPAPENVNQLVQRFEENIDSYRSSKFNETQLRREIESVDRAIDRLVYELSHKGMKSRWWNETKMLEIKSKMIFWRVYA